MEFRLKANDDTELRLPVNPAEFTISKANQNQTVNINEIGEINIIGKPGLASISLASFFPAQEYSFCEYHGFPDPYKCINMIDAWKQKGQVIRLIITDTDINMLMAIESFEYGQKGGSGDVNYSLSLKEYRELKITNSPGSTAAAVTTRPATKEPPKEYTVKSGDCLWMIAKRLTGDGANYTAIAKKNGIKNPNLIYPGQKLVIT